MSNLSDSIHRRVVSRFLCSQGIDRNSQGRQAFFWHLPAPKPHIPDDIVVQCSSGCTLTAREIERMLSKRLNVAPGSCRIAPVPANDEANKTRFEVKTIDGKRVTGTITVNMLASERQVDAFTVVDLDT